MRVARWEPDSVNEIIENASFDALMKGAEVIKANAQRLCPVGTESRPIYKKGPYAGQPWTARDAGALKKSIRIVQKTSKSGKPLVRLRNIRVYAGNYLAYYASIVEHAGKAFMRPAVENRGAILSAIKGE
jgi:hypothetical protein